MVDRAYRHSKVLEQMAKDYPKYIEEYWVEEDSGHWIFLREGYITLMTECRTIHEWSVKDAVHAFKKCLARVENNKYVDVIPVKG